jgi:hypothetical protein
VHNNFHQNIAMSTNCHCFIGCKLMPSWPVDRPRDWASLVNRPLDEPRRQQILESLRHGRPLGGENWTRKMPKSSGFCTPSIQEADREN